MARWDPDAAGRLQRAATELYLERGFADVTVEQVAARAGLTKRTFFRYFADKREVLFAGAQAFQAAVVTGVLDAPAGTAPIEVVITALADGGAQLAQFVEFARRRRDLIASSTDLQERELIKMAALTAAVASALRHRGVDPARATLTAHAASAVFTTAYDRWVDQDGGSDLRTLLHVTLDDLRRSIDR